MTREQLRADRARHNEVTARGWTLLHLTDHDVYRAPQQMVRAAARALRIPDPPELRHLRPAPLIPPLRRSRTPGHRGPAWRAHRSVINGAELGG